MPSHGSRSLAWALHISVAISGDTRFSILSCSNESRSEDMKVVLFCGGLGLRIRDAENIPKPMVEIGCRPILWHFIKYYTPYGHKYFILCLGYGAVAIKKYFLIYSEL